MSDPKTYLAFWTIPDARGMSVNRFPGMLTYSGDGPSVLELILQPNFGSIAVNGYNEVIWGEDARNQKYTLFGVRLRNDGGFTGYKFDVSCVLVGEHLKTMEEASFDKCWVRYNYLNRWALDNRFKGMSDRQRTIVSYDNGNRDSFLSLELDEQTKLMLFSRIEESFSDYSISASQVTDLCIALPEKASVDRFLHIVQEFTDFLSIALFSEQYPEEIVFTKNGINYRYSFLFEKKGATEPQAHPLIKLNEMRERIPGILKTWHSHYEQVTPICNYLIRSIENKGFINAPDFLIVAQALDGYFKRFVNHKDGKDIKQYKHQIEKLLRSFRNVDAVNRCHIDAEVLSQTRHKYSHLIPDDDGKINKAVSGWDLYWLTQKSIILLTCCILDLLGLSSDEINTCCKYSPIEQIINSFPIWIEPR